jgi:hypothetical protein
LNPRFITRFSDANFSSSIKLGVRYFSNTTICRVDDKPISPCGLPDCDKPHYNQYISPERFTKFKQEFDRNNKRPGLTNSTIDMLKYENPRDIAIAFKDNPEGLKDRFNKIITHFEKLSGEDKVYLIQKNNYVIEKVLNENPELCKLQIMKLLIENPYTD